MSKRVLIVHPSASKVVPYTDALRQAGIEPHLVSPTERAHLQGYAGLLLAGGSDVDPGVYSAARQPETEEPDHERDALELKLIQEAMDGDVPLLAICRGLQIFNVSQGGTLIQHLPTTAHHQRAPKDPGQPAHEVLIEPETVLAAVMGLRTVSVNSRHHQAADRVGKGLRVSGRACDDQTIEALEHPGKRFALAVQWHPENQTSRPEQASLFSAFANAL